MAFEQQGGLDDQKQKEQDRCIGLQTDDEQKHACQIQQQGNHVLVSRPKRLAAVLQGKEQSASASTEEDKRMIEILTKRLESLL